MTTDNSNAATLFGAKFQTGITLLSQQLNAEMEAACEQAPETPVGADVLYTDFGGIVRMQPKTGRNEDIPIIEQAYTRRAIVPTPTWVGDYVDSMDKLKSNTDPTSSKMMAQAAAGARDFDKTVIAAGLGDATQYAGKTLSTVSLPAAQKVLIAVGGAGANTGLNLTKFLTAARILKTGQIIKKGMTVDVHFACTARQEQEFINTTEVKSSDFSNTKVLMDGGLDVFYRVKFHLIEDVTDAAADRIIPYDGTTRKCMMWARTGIRYAWWQRPLGEIEWDITKKSFLVSNRQMCGAVRTQDAMVVEVDCLETH